MGHRRATTESTREDCYDRQRPRDESVGQADFYQTAHGRLLSGTSTVFLRRVGVELFEKRAKLCSFFGAELLRFQQM